MPLKVTKIDENITLLQTPDYPFTSNSYIVTLKNKEEKLNILIDPTPQEYFKDLVLSLKDLIGGVENLDLIYVNHQDPDVTSSLAPLMDMNKNLLLIASEDTWRLIRFYGLSRDRFQPIEYFPNRRVILKTDDTLEFIHTPFCHFRGSWMLYIPEKKALFSGDLLGGLSTREVNGIYANEDSWDGIKLFHEIYMPSREALRLAVDKIGRLTPIPELILPQHGDIIRKNLILNFLAKLNDLEVGLDYIKNAEKQHQVYLFAFNEILQNLKNNYANRDKLMQKLKELNSSQFFPELIHFENGVAVEFRIQPESAIELLYDKFIEDASPTEKENLRIDIIKTLRKYNLDIPEGILAEKQRNTENLFTRIFKIFQR
ncbi:MAG: MBL fold metallo-hydrolase [Dictyoglomus sp.]